jgi:hypothetical protein
MPYVVLRNNSFWWTCPFLDWPLICLCWQRYGIDRLLSERTFYRIGEGGAWSSQSPAKKHQLIRFAVRQMILFGSYSVRNKLSLWRYAQSLPKHAKK